MNKIILFFSSVAGIGYIKYAPGTFGSLAGIILWALFVPQNYKFHLISVLCIFIISTAFSSMAEDIYGKKDDQRIVIDEVAGVWVALAFLPKTILFLSLGFILFRIFDIKKPFFIKKLQKLKGGFGITVDDIVAGIYANVILQILNLVL